MAQKVTIDVEARFIDNLTGKVGRADKAIDNLGKKRPKVVVDANTAKPDKKIPKLDKELDKLGRKKPRPTIDANDKASRIITKIADKAESIAKKVYTAAVKVRDSEALNYLSKFEARAKSIAGKTWTAVVKIKDMTLAPFRAIKNNLLSLKTLVAGLVLGATAKKTILDPIALADQYSSAKIGFSTLLGESKGQDMMNEIDAFAKATPFKTQGVISNVQKMMAYGWDVNRVIKDMKTIGDAAAATGKGDQGLESIVYALSEIRSKGKLSTQELNQLASAGIKAKAYLAEGLGYGTSDKGMAALAKDLEKGAVGANQAIDLILQGMKEFDGMMDKTANETVEGLKSQLEDTWEINIARRWGQGLQDGAKRGLGTVVSMLDDADGALEKFGDTVYDVGKYLSNYLADALGNTVKRVQEITDTDAFKKADLGKKISMLWEGAIANPFSKWWGRTVVPWWEKTAVPWFKDKAVSLGKTIGKAIADALGNAWDALPDWGKLLIGGYGAAKVAGGISSLAGGVASLAGGAGKLFSGAAGAGASAKMVKLAEFLGAGGSGLAGAGGTALSGGAMAALGAGAAAGGIVGGATVISGANDLYNGFTGASGNAEMDKANKISGGLKIGGVGAGAAAGAAIGSVVPVIGTAIGGLIGAGVGGVAGWLGGNKIKENAAENIKSLKELAKQAKDNSEAEDVLSQKNKALAKVLGDVSLSYQEVQEVAKNVVTGDMAEGMSAFSTASADANQSMEKLAGSTEALNKLNWKASVGFKFDEAGQQQYKQAVQNYIESAEATVENQHYKFTAAVEMLIDPKSGPDQTGYNILKQGDAFYGKLQEELNTTSTKLEKQVDIALKDGVIDADEGAIIEKLQNKIAEITNKVNEAQSEAGFEALKIKFGAGNIDAESFNQLQGEIAKKLEESQGTYDEALTTSITSLKLQLDEGAINQEEYDAQIKALTEGYEANVGELSAKAEKVQLDILGDAWDIDAGALSEGLHASLKDGIAPMTWSAEDAQRYLNIEGLTASQAEGIGTALQSVAETAKLDLSAAQVTGGEALNAKIQTKITGKPITVTPTINALPKVNNKFMGTAADFGVQPAYEYGTNADINAKFKGNNFPGKKSDFGIKDAYNFSTSVNITRKFNYKDVGKQNNPGGGGKNGGGGKKNDDGNGFRGRIVYPYGNNIPGFSDGGWVQGGAQLIKVAEEGTPEAIIPLGIQRRKRGLQLWEQAGHMMGVPGFANGGIVGGNQDEGIRNMQSGGSSSGTAGGGPVQVDVGGVTVEVNVTGGGDENVAEAIRNQSGEIAEEIAGILAEAFNAQFSNTPTKGVA